MGELKLMKGNEALAEAAIRCGADAYFGYPITPQSEAARRGRMSATARSRQTARRSTTSLIMATVLTCGVPGAPTLPSHGGRTCRSSASGLSAATSAAGLYPSPPTAALSPGPILPDIFRLLTRTA